MTISNLKELNIVELSLNEMKAIDGGNWLDDAGTWCGETWCRVKQNFSSGFASGFSAADGTK